MTIINLSIKEKLFDMSWEYKKPKDVWVVLKKIIDTKFFSTNVNSKQIDKSQDGQGNMNGGLSCQQQRFVKLVGWF